MEEAYIYTENIMEYSQIHAQIFTCAGRELKSGPYAPEEHVLTTRLQQSLVHMRTPQGLLRKIMSFLNTPVELSTLLGKI